MFTPGSPCKSSDRPPPSEGDPLARMLARAEDDLQKLQDQGHNNMATSNLEQLRAKRNQLRRVMNEAGGPGEADGWDACWKQALTTWDLGKATPVLRSLIAEGKIPCRARVLVPGCGSGYDCMLLATEAECHVTGLDISESGIEVARRLCGQTPQVELLLADFFSDFDSTGEGFDFIFDYTFFCALPPTMRAAWGKRTSELLKPGGLLLTLMYPVDEKLASDPDVPGPPFKVSPAEYEKALCPHGLQLCGPPEPSDHSVELRKQQGEFVAFWSHRH